MSLILCLVGQSADSGRRLFRVLEMLGSRTRSEQPAIPERSAARGKMHSFPERLTRRTIRVTTANHDEISWSFNADDVDIDLPRLMGIS